MTWATISTWRMSFDGLQKASDLLENRQSAASAVEKLINAVEDNPAYQSVGYGGLPNEDGIVQMDAGFMDGDSLAQGSVAAIENVKHAVSVARQLSQNKTSSFLVGAGATKYAQRNGFEFVNMLTPKAKEAWQSRKEEQIQQELKPYDGHDTVGAITLDQNGSLCAATSTSGLFMKKDGRIGDSPLSGSGFYADSQVGAATATGLGEDIMKGCLSYEIVRKMAEGKDPQTACDEALFSFVANLEKRYGSAGAISLIALNKKGEWGVATNVQFAFCVASEQEKPQVYLAQPKADKTTIFPFTQEWLDNYEREMNMTVD